MGDGGKSYKRSTEPVQRAREHYETRADRRTDKGPCYPNLNTLTGILAMKRRIQKAERRIARGVDQRVEKNGTVRETEIADRLRSLLPSEQKEVTT